jgi:hypothetical protein
MVVREGSRPFPWSSGGRNASAVHQHRGPLVEVFGHADGDVAGREADEARAGHVELERHPIGPSIAAPFEVPSRPRLEQSHRMLLLVDGTPDADRQGLLAAARALGRRVQAVAADGSLGLERGDFQWGVLLQDRGAPARYRAIHDAARAANVTLLNDLAQHLDATELHRTVARLEGLTAKTRVVQSPGELDAALEQLPLPLFVKSTNASHKALGWKACVAETTDEVKTLAAALAPPLLLRELLPLRRTGSTWEGFPVAREYRLFVLDADIVGAGFTWPGGDPFGVLTEREDREMRALAHEVAARTRVPWLCVDVGQLESGEWKLIETGDPSSCRLGSIEPRHFLGSLAHGLELRAGC